MRIVSFILLLLLFSCSQKKKGTEDRSYQLRIEFENIDGLEKGAPVLFQGVKVGEVEELKINTDQSGIDVTVSIDTLKIPVGSDFTIFSSDLLGRRAINVEFSISNEFLENNATVNGKMQQSLGARVEDEVKELRKFIEERVEILENNDSVLIIKFRKEDLDTNLLHYVIDYLK